MAYNTTYYAVQLQCYNVPTSLPTEYTNPSGMTLRLLRQHRNLLYQVQITFGTIIGFSAGTYPSVPQTTTQNRFIKYHTKWIASKFINNEM